MRLAKPDLMPLLARCTTIYRLPKGVEIPILAEEWYRQLRQFEAEDVTAAVEAYLSSEARFFPLPGSIKTLAYAARRQRGPDLGDLRAQYWRWFQDGMEGPCPVCGAVLACLTCGKIECRQDHGRLGVQHDHRRHMERGIPYVGPRSPLAHAPLESINR